MSGWQKKDDVFEWSGPGEAPTFNDRVDALEAHVFGEVESRLDGIESRLSVDKTPNYERLWMSLRDKVVCEYTEGSPSPSKRERHRFDVLAEVLSWIAELENEEAS